MISFGIMTVLLVVMACVVHYDLLGVFPLNNPYGRQSTDGRHQPLYEFEPAWLPSKGTDPNTFYSGSNPSVIVDDYSDYYDDDGDDDDDYWSSVKTDVDDDETGNDSDKTCFVGGDSRSTNDGACIVGDHRSRNDLVDRDENASSETIASSTTSNYDADDDEDEYVAPGEERDEHVF